ncbi:hypothetical protein F5Y12DRAFT_712458 [Xylaria sp. FL1777]|nr:hypothetical protein F5Y12DRAFT_712458 [Xylaria sp. FL1777]
MFILSPHPHREKGIQLPDAQKTTINDQLYNYRSSYIASPEILKKPTALPNPPRPPTPGPPRPYPPVPPHPPEPTPPPSPQYHLCSVDPQLSILVSRTEPFQCPYPDPPPSPGPRRPGPVRPRPNVPTPPPSPRRSTTPWIFYNASSLVDLILMYISLATWDGDTATECVSMATEGGICSKWHSSPLLRPALLSRDLPGSLWHQSVTADTFMTALGEDVLIINTSLVTGHERQ